MLQIMFVFLLTYCKPMYNKEQAVILVARRDYSLIEFIIGQGNSLNGVCTLTSGKLHGNDVRQHCSCFLLSCKLRQQYLYLEPKELSGRSYFCTIFVINIIIYMCFQHSNVL